MNKIYTGQPYLYRQSGYNSTIIEVCMKKSIRGDSIFEALRKTLKRYPYFSHKLVEKDGSYFLSEAYGAMIPVKTDKFRTLGSIKTGYHLVDVTYTNNKIRVAFHHSICDGHGIKPFVETLIYYYCCLRYNKKLDSTGVQLENDPILEGETSEPFSMDKFEVSEANFPDIIKDGFALPENSDEVTTFHRTELKLNNQQFIAFAKKNNATPAILLSLLASTSIKNMYPDADKPVVCSMATDYRNVLGATNTHKNCVGSIYLPLTATIESQSLLEQATLYRTFISEQKSPDLVKIAVNSQIGLFEKLNQMESLEEKRKMMSFFDNICIDTYVISYLGRMEFGGANDYVESTHLYSSGTKGLILNMVSAGEFMTVDILQSFESNEFILALQENLDKTGIKYELSNQKGFETPKDIAFITARKQAERFYK